MLRLARQGHPVPAPIDAVEVIVAGKAVPVDVRTESGFAGSGEEERLLDLGIVRDDPRRDLPALSARMTYELVGNEMRVVDRAIDQRNDLERSHETPPPCSPETTSLTSASHARRQAASPKIGSKKRLGEY